MQQEPQHIVVFGFKGVARRIVKQLAKVSPRVLVVDPELGQSELDTLARYGVEYLPGYGQSQDVLEAADIRNARAAVCATNDDLRNIEIALLVREMSADIRIVVQMANGNVGAALQRVTQPSVVLDVAELASMSFVEQAVNRAAHPIALGRRRFYVTNARTTKPGTLREVFGDVAPIAVRSLEGDTSTCPSRDRRVQVDDLVTLLGTEDELRAIGLSEKLVTPKAHRRHLMHRMRETFSATLDAIDTPFRIALGVIAGLAAVSVGVLMAGYVGPGGQRMGFLDAVYFTVETIATVGFGDFSFRYQEPWLRSWAIVMMLLGATLVYTAVAFLTNALVSRRLAQSIGRQRVTGMRDHIAKVSARLAAKSHSICRRPGTTSP